MARYKSASGDLRIWQTAPAATAKQPYKIASKRDG